MTDIRPGRELSTQVAEAMGWTYRKKEYERRDGPSKGTYGAWYDAAGKEWGGVRAYSTDPTTATEMFEWLAKRFLFVRVEKRHKVHTVEASDDYDYNDMDDVYAINELLLLALCGAVLNSKEANDADTYTD